jgi:hypothetical protein
MTDKDKTVGGRTLEGWQSWALHMQQSTWRFDRGDAEDVAELVAEAFGAYSRGIRDGLERAARGLEDVLKQITIESEGKTVKISRSVQMVVQLLAALRAEASKLDGEEPHVCSPDSVSGTFCNTATPKTHRGCRCVPGRCGIHPHLPTCGLRLESRPEPPAEERKPPLGHDYHGDGDSCEFWLSRGIPRPCGRPRSAHEPT